MRNIEAKPLNGTSSSLACYVLDEVLPHCRHINIGRYNFVAYRTCENQAVPFRSVRSCASYCIHSQVGNQCIAVRAIGLHALVLLH